MKKLILLAMSILTLNIVFAQKENVIKINILSPIVKTFNVQYERKLNESSSVQLGFFYTGYSANETTFSGFGITPEYRFYLTDEALQGVYIAPFLRYQDFSLTESISNGKATQSTFGGGVILGKQWLFKEKIALDIFIGPSYASGDVKVTSGTGTFNTNAFDGFGLRAGLCFGFAF
ncbi:MAG: DUF3575 domain-containing protein [Cyclobacteriaceae bacterium]|nr:DUF3575 domain-containing protein [Cyclobacteriaceae bacterium]